MAKGAIAKENLINELKTKFGDKFIGVYDKKVYILSEENGEPVQIALSLTCPKVPVEATGGLDFGQGRDFSGDPGAFGATAAAPTQAKTTEISEEEQETVRQLMRRLGL